MKYLNSIRRTIFSIFIVFYRLYKEDRLVNSSLNLRNYFNNPDLIEQPEYLDALIRGLATQSSQQMDLKFTDDVGSNP